MRLYFSLKIYGKSWKTSNELHQFTRKSNWIKRRMAKIKPTCLVWRTLGRGDWQKAIQSSNFPAVWETMNVRVGSDVSIKTEIPKSKESIFSQGKETYILCFKWDRHQPFPSFGMGDDLWKNKSFFYWLNEHLTSSIFMKPVQKELITSKMNVSFCNKCVCWLFCNQD